MPKWKQQSAQLQAAMLAARPAKLARAAAAFPGAVEVDQVGAGSVKLLWLVIPSYLCVNAGSDVLLCSPSP